MLYVSFDYCHIIKNVRSQFIDKNRLLCNNGKLVDPRYLMQVLHLQKQNQKGFKLVRGLTRKHLHPTSFEKMNVKRAVDIFKPEVTRVLLTNAVGN